MNGKGQMSPALLLTGTFIVFLLPVMLVGLFPAQLDTVIEKSTYLVFHNTAEFFSIMVSLTVFSVGWFTFEQSRDRHTLFLGTAFLAVGLLDFMHTMSNVAMPTFISSNSTNKSTQFWLAARLFDSSALLLSAFIYTDNKSRWLSKWILLLSALTVTALAFTGVVFFPDHIPATAIPGVGLTPLKRVTEFLVITLLFSAFVAYWNRMKRTQNREIVYYLAAFIICMFSEAFFASYKTGFDTYNVLGHIYKVIAFYLIYKGVFISSVNTPYLKLSAAMDELRQDSVSLTVLEKEVEERKRAEEALHNAYDELEQRVAERTRELREAELVLKRNNETLEQRVVERMVELQSANKDLADSRRAAINLLQDALAARRQAEDVAFALHESEERLRTLSDQIPGGAIYQHVQDHEGRVHYTYMSAGIERLFGLPAERVLADPDSFRQLIHEEDGPRVAAAEEQSAQELTPFDCEFRQRTVTGEIKWMQCRSMPRRMEDASTVWDGVVVDITERKLAEETLRQFNEQLEQRVAERTVELAEAGEKIRAERQRFLDMLDTLPVIIDIIRADHRIEWANRAYRLALGDNTGQLCYQSQFGWDTPCQECQAFVPLKTGQPHHWEWTLPNGRTFDIYNFPFAAIDGSPAVLEMDIDITELRQAETVLKDVNATLELRVAERTAELLQEVEVRKQAEEALRESEEQFRRAIEEAPIPVIMHAEDGQVLQISHTWTDLTGYTPEDMLTFDSWLNRAYGAGTEEVRSHVHCLFKGDRRTLEVEIPILTASGESRYWSFSASSPGVLADGRRFVVGMAVDITERKRSEEDLKKAHSELALQMEERGRELHEKEVLLKEIHHRVKNNLQVISSLVNLQADTIENPEVRALFRDVRDRVRSMALVHEKLYHSESLANVRFDEYAGSLMNYLWHAHGSTAASIRLTLDLQPITLSVEKAVPCGLILNELVSNALKHAFRGRPAGEITTTLHKTKDSSICLSVGDNGVGIPSELDWRQSSSLGLRLVMMLAGQLNAAVEVNCDHGTEFRISFKLPEEGTLEGIKHE